MQTQTHRRVLSGFTIIELLVVIMVIAVLASIVAVAYNGVQTRAINTKIVSSVNSSVKLLNLYHAENDKWPRENIAPTTYTYKYCLGRDFPLWTYGGSSTSESPNIRLPRRGCGDIFSSVKFEASWMSDVVAPYGTLPQATALIDGWRYAPVYGAVNDGYSLEYASAGLSYPTVNGSVQNGTAYFVEFSLKGDVPNCGGVPHAQKIADYDGTTACLIMLEFYGV